MKVAILVIVFEDDKDTHVRYHTHFGDDVKFGDVALANLSLDEVKAELLQMAESFETELEYVSSGNDGEVRE